MEYKGYIKLALYRNTKRDILSRMIQIWQVMLGLGIYSKYTHTEIIIDDNWFASSFVDGGVRIKTIDPIHNHWDYIIIPVTKTEKEDIKNFLMSKIGCDYDLKNIFFNQILPCSIDNTDKWICSEYSAEALDVLSGVSMNNTADRYSPGDLVEELVESKGMFIITQQNIRTEP